jgi:hypothetical protein
MRNPLRIAGKPRQRQRNREPRARETPGGPIHGRFGRGSRARLTGAGAQQGTPGAAARAATPAHTSHPLLEKGKVAMTRVFRMIIPVSLSGLFASAAILACHHRSEPPAAPRPEATTPVGEPAPPVPPNGEGNAMPDGGMGPLAPPPSAPQAALQQGIGGPDVLLASQPVTPSPTGAPPPPGTPSPSSPTPAPGVPSPGAPTPGMPPSPTGPSQPGAPTPAPGTPQAPSLAGREDPDRDRDQTEGQGRRVDGAGGHAIARCDRRTSAGRRAREELAGRA